MPNRGVQERIIEEKMISVKQTGSFARGSCLRRLTEPAKKQPNNQKYTGEAKVSELRRGRSLYTGSETFSQYK
jgi:hypothetical protein